MVAISYLSNDKKVLIKISEPMEVIPAYKRIFKMLNIDFDITDCTPIDKVIEACNGTISMSICPENFDHNLQFHH